MTGSIFIITRYSVLDKVTGGLRLPQTSATPEAYRDKLFDEDRLHARHQVFDLVNAASLRAQDPCPADIYHLVCISDVLPPAHLAKLQATLAAVEENSRVQPRLCVVASGFPDGRGPAHSTLSQAVETVIRGALAGRDAAFATVRLDDDDALAPTFCADLSKLLTRGSAGLVASFPYGLQGVFDPAAGAIVDVRRRYSPGIALGLSLLNFHHADGSYADPRIHVHRIGSHMTVGRTNSVVLSAQRVSFLRMVTRYNDSSAAGRHGIQPAAFAEEIACFKGLPFQQATAGAEPFA